MTQFHIIKEAVKASKNAQRETIYEIRQLSFEKKTNKKYDSYLLKKN